MEQLLKQWNNENNYNFQNIQDNTSKSSFLIAALQ